MTHDVVDLSQFRHLFFFSYARLEQDTYLQRFVDDLSATVTRKVAHMEPSFRDLDQIAPGDHWPTRLIDALQASAPQMVISADVRAKVLENVVDLAKDSDDSDRGAGDD